MQAAFAVLATTAAAFNCLLVNARYLADRFALACSVELGSSYLIQLNETSDLICINSVGLGVLTAADMKSTIFWGTIQYGPLKVNPRFRGNMLPPSSGSNNPGKLLAYRRQTTY
jgi:hypothetical protein